MTVLAYIVTVIISQFGLLAGDLMAAMPALVLAWAPSHVRAPFLGLLGGIAGPICSVLIARVIFGWLVGEGSFGWGPFAAATIPLIIPLRNDYRVYANLRDLLRTSTPVVAEFARPDVTSRAAGLIGVPIGILVAGILLV